MPKHYHVGANTPGYLPDSYLACHSNAEDAVAGLGSDLVYWTEGEDDWTDEVENVARLGRELEDRSSQKHQGAVHDVEYSGSFEFLFTGELGDRVFFIAVVDEPEPCPDQDG